MNEFFSDGGTTTFIDRLCAALGIHASTVKVVAVYQGSVIVQYQINSVDDSGNPIDYNLTYVQSNLTALM